MTKISKELEEDVLACVENKKSPGKCIDKALEEHGIDSEEKSSVLQTVLKRSVK